MMSDGALSSSSSEEVDLAIAKLIRRTASAVGKECEARWEQQVNKLIKDEAAKTAARFDTERVETTNQMRKMEERLWEDICQVRRAGASSSIASTSRVCDGDRRPRRITVKGWVLDWEARLEMGLAPEEVDKWLAEFRQAEAVNNCGSVDSTAGCGGPSSSSRSQTGAACERLGP